MTIAEAGRNFTDLINRIASRGDTAILTRDGSVVARIVPEPTKIKGKAGKFLEMRNNLPRLSPAEAEEFALDIENGRKFCNKSTSDPWTE